MRKNEIAEGLDVSGTATINTLTVTSAITVPANSLLASSGALVTNETNNRVVTSLGANAGLNAEQNLTFDGTTLALASTGAFTHTNYKLSGSKALTGGSATAFATVAVPSSGYCGGNVEYTIIATDTTDFQCRSGIVCFAAANKAGTVAIHVTDNLIGADAQSGTTTGITATFSGAEDSANVLSLKCNAASDLTETVLTIYYTINCQYPNTITAG